MSTKEAKGDKPLSGKERSQQLALERRAARLAAVQALYQWEQTGAKAEAVIAEFGAHRMAKGQGAEEVSDLAPADRKLFAEIVRGVAADVAQLDDMLSAVLSEEWRIERLESILRAIMRAGAFELVHRPDVPPRVVISEYLAVTDAFFGDRETAMVNGVLDKLAHELRPDEMGATRGGPGTR
ncbi:NusB antitermination factor [Dongia mobilis]|uniref:Transcription antitermination protein NusB n=1 Tax=Dongia mobilis TaxID=578943 RepID=A0A4R6WV27_9PROT|nr:transcription antitermination factor NusB [Dongia mobilis]TDQ80949.1 NusB antitermination factor [Dongia mobilis]